ncbi:hypothetical protein ACMHYB_13925 [Sorangium sp. So ce1128]
MHDGNVIASRHLTFTLKDEGLPRKVHELLGKPHSPVHRDNEWVVDIEIQESFKQAILEPRAAPTPFKRFISRWSKPAR